MIFKQIHDLKSKRSRFLMELLSVIYETDSEEIVEVIEDAQA